MYQDQSIPCTQDQDPCVQDEDHDFNLFPPDSDHGWNKKPKK